MTVRILAVDDIESNLVALEAVLQGSAVTMVRARSGQEALCALLKEDFALILLDVQMPGMDGFDTAAAIREREKNSRTPIIFLTAYGSGREKLARAYAVGAADFLAKPFDPEALRAKVRTIADLWRRIDETKVQAAQASERHLAEERQRWETDALRARIADQEKMAAAEHAARLQAESANRIKDEFLATLSHELRTPLNAMLGWATTLKRKGVADPAMVRGLDAIERNARAQARLIEDLLDTSSIVAGKVRLDLRATTTAEIIDGVNDAVRYAAERKRIAVEIVIQDGLAPVVCDPDRMQQVLANVLSNAIKFTPEGGRVTLHADRAGSRIRIQVKDTGAGIAAEFLPQVFDRFRQGEAGTTRAQGGLGLGLFLAKHLMALHGGTISADSEGQGKGTTFTIVFPIRAVAVREGESTDDRSTSPVTASLMDVRALVVDDEADARDWVREVLENAGATVLTVDSADGALEAFIAWHPDVIVSDIGMPRQDGYALIRRIRALPDRSGERIPAAALTAYASDADVARARVAGFQSHLAKPVDPTRLVSTVAGLVGRGGDGG
jgi:signal transduction histidine kinase